MEEFQIINNSKENRLQAVLGGHLAMLNYQIRGSIFQIDYVYVPPQYRNHGFGALLMEGVVDFARENGLQVVPVSGFAASVFAASCTGVTLTSFPVALSVMDEPSLDEAPSGVTELPSLAGEASENTRAGASSSSLHAPSATMEAVAETTRTKRRAGKEGRIRFRYHVVE